MDEGSKTSMASVSSDDSSSMNASFSLDNVKQERLDQPNFYPDSGFDQSGSQNSKEKSRSTKRPYQKKPKSVKSGSVEKPPPKKRGRKSKKELSMMERKVDYAMEFEPTFKKSKMKSPSEQKPPRAPKKTTTTKSKKVPGPPPGPSVFDKKILAGPHLTMKQVLEYILTDHSYCVPPDPLPAVGSNHQMIRYILGPKNGAKARSLPNVVMLDPEERSPLAYASISRARTQLSLSSNPSSPASKLENLLKRGESSPLHLGGGAMRFPHSKSLADGRDESDIDIDIESVDPEPEKRVAYDVRKAREVMKECEKYVEFARTVDTGDNWESKIVKTGWTKAQSALYEKVIGALHAERLARLTYESAGDTEPVLRRASLDKTACRVRRIFGEYIWDTKLTQWLHSVLTEYLNFAYLAIYMDVLQTLKSQCPQLITRMMKLSIITPLQSAHGRNNELQDLLTPYLEDGDSDNPAFPFDSTHSKAEKHAVLSQELSSSADQDISLNKLPESDIYIPAKSVAPQVEDAMVQLHSAKNAEAFRMLLERQWDPFSQDVLPRLKKLSANPVFVVIAPGAIFTKLSLNRRLKQYYRMFNRVGKVVKVRPNSHAALEMTSPSNYLERLFALAKEKIKDVRHCFPERPLFIVGWGSGSILAARLSVTTGPVDGIVALGFPLHSLREIQEDVLRIFGGIKHPILFVIGGLASNNSLTDMELFRRRLACETSLVVVGSGNENLYVTRDHREKLLITQSYVDKTVMDEIAYFVNLHSKHNQIIAANISMKPHHFSKSQADTYNSRKSMSLLRGKKRKSSFNDMDNESFVGSNNEDSKDSYDSEIERAHETGASHRREADASKLGTYDYGFDGPQFVPSNKSCNKRKAYSSYRPDPNSSSSSMGSSSCITASQLLQQSPNVKRRMSKPSGPTQRLPFGNQQPSQRSSTGQMMDPPKDDAAALYKYLTEHHQNQSKAQAQQYPYVFREGDGGAYPTGNERMLMGSYTSDNSSDKASKKKSNGKSKASKLAKTNSTESPVSSIVSALNEVTPPPSNQGTTSPMEMRKLVQQMRMKQHEQIQDRSHSSQLFKLLSPDGGSSMDNINMTPMPASSQGSAELVKVKLMGSQTLPSEVAGETRTALISKHNLVSNVSLPMIRVSRSGGTGECSDQSSVFFTGTPTSGSSILANLPTDSSDRILLRTSDQSVMKLNAADLKNLIAGGRGIQLFTGVGVPNSGPVNIIVKKQSESNDSSTLGGESMGTSAMAQTLTTPSLVIPVSETFKTLDGSGISAAQIEATNVVATFEPPPINKTEDLPVDPLAETEPMEADTDEEMSGLLISSTFSVCPTSGERVLPSAITDVSMSSEDILKADVLGAEDNEEVLSVPIHIQNSCVTLSSENLVPLTPLESEADTNVQTPAANGQVQNVPPNSNSLITLTSLEASPSAQNMTPTSIVNTSPAPNLFFAVKSKPKELKPDDEKNKGTPDPVSPTKKAKAAKQTTKVASKSKPKKEKDSLLGSTTTEPSKPSKKEKDSLSGTSSNEPSKPSKKEKDSVPGTSSNEPSKPNKKAAVKNPPKPNSAEKDKPSPAPSDRKKPREKSKKDTTVPPTTPEVKTALKKCEAPVDVVSHYKKAPTDSNKESKNVETCEESSSSVVSTANASDAQNMDTSETPSKEEASSSSSTTAISDVDNSVNTESEPSEKNDDCDKSKSEDPSDSGTDESKSKNNPVRRSARLKSGV